MLNKPTSYRIKLSSKGQMVLPAQLRHDLGLKSGDELQLTVAADGSMTLEAKPLDWNDLIKGLPTENVDIDENGNFDKSQSPEFYKWMKGDDPD
ncbi:AbrB/MazE/SpoVT family DNA-binding domain-containing protein [Levilactobacillus zymae]|uniref:AbrB/MazE/SpoVT family DNA-binding domain-containing protein n=1 Tax=Levilactobacillus zymae TaxID=267363 RepID=UPI0028B3AF8A|nr:AbrB/MazE/SpoVT family DNA-binding domain-containing protein [Levilactobacillus zymae]MDT6980711.1 AbrB/MazE/SpoVT family DNA-binding domain-containing protein [Levilactobacillus zymae]